LNEVKTRNGAAKQLAAPGLKFSCSNTRAAINKWPAS